MNNSNRGRPFVARRGRWRHVVTPILGLTVVVGAVLSGITIQTTSATALSINAPHHPAPTPRPHSFTYPIYAPGEFFGGSNPVAVCFTCQAASITGTAPPSASLDAGAGVNNLTGDFTTDQTFFKAPNIGGSLSFRLTYDAQLAQAELPLGGTQQLGWGWTSNLQASATQLGSPSNAIVINQGNDSQVRFDPVSGTSCAGIGGDQTSTSRYTEANWFASAHNWCALANVQAQLGDAVGTQFVYEQAGGRGIDIFAWNGTLTESGSYQSVNNNGGYIKAYYSVAPGSQVATGLPNNQPCPTTATSCTLFYGVDGRDIVEAMNSTRQVTEVIDPSGVTYTLSYDSHGNLQALTEFANQSAPSTWNYVYDTGQASPYSSDLTQVYDPNAGVTTPASSSPGAAHSTAVAYAHSGSNVGQVSSLKDGTGATTTYSYTTDCATTSCFGSSVNQQTTTTYPAQVPCPSCTAQSPVEIANYTAGVETSDSLGSSTNPTNNETWGYSWTMGYGAGNSTETITYPHTLSGTAATATIVQDAAGNVTSTTNALGDIATSAYNDTGSNVLPELLWSYPGSSSNPPGSPPSGSWIYTYDSNGNVATATDPVGNVTGYGYYPTSGLLCALEPPSITKGSNCTGAGTAGPASVWLGATTYTYDTFGDVTKRSVDYNDSTTVQTTTATYDLMGNQLWSIPPAGQGGVQSSANPYATVTTYTPAGLPMSVTSPGLAIYNYTYDAALNSISAGYAGLYRYQITVYDADNRPCYVVQDYGITPSGCTAASQGGSTQYTYVPGSTNVATKTDSNNLTTTYYYGDLAHPNSPTEVVDAAGTTIQYGAYDDFGNSCVSGSVAPSFGTSTQCSTLAGDASSVYNALGNRLSTTDPSGNATTYAYTNTTYPSLETSSTNALSAVTSYAYDADGRLVTITNPDATTIKTGYDGDSRVCTKSVSGTAYACGTGSGVTGVTTFSYNGANERTAMTTYTPSAQSTTYSFKNGQLTSTTDLNGKTTAYLYNYGGQVECVTYPISTSQSCGTISSPSTGSSTNTIATKSYDSMGRLSTLTDWLGNTTTYGYGDYWAPNTPTSITYPTSTGLTASYGLTNTGQVNSLTAGTAINDSWTYDANERSAVTTINGAASPWATYNGKSQITGAANLATSTNNDTYTIAASGSILKDVPPTGSTYSFGYNAGSQLCWAANVPSSASCSSPPTASIITNFTYTSSGQRASAATTTGSGTTTTNYAWNAYDQLCNVSMGSSTSCGSTPSSGASYIYNNDGLRTTSTTDTTATGTTATVGTLQQATGTGLSTLSVSPVNVGDALVLAAKVKDTSVTMTAVSGGGATWQKLTNAGSNPDVELWLGTIATTGSSTITVSYSGSVASDTIELDAQEYTNGTGSSTTWASDVVGSSNNTTSSTSVTFPTLTPISSHELYVGFARVPNTGVAGSTSGFTYDVTSPNTNLYIFNPNVSSVTSPTAGQTPTGTSIAVGALIKASGATSTSTTDSTWDQLSGGSTPLNINDATTTSGVTANTSYLYGDLLLGGTAPVEQISGSTATFLVANQTGVQGVFNSIGTNLEQALYSTYGVQTITSGSKVTPFGYQGSYSDGTGLTYLINRYFDPTTDQFLSVDPLVSQTGQPYAFVNDGPLNATDPTGLYAAALMGWGEVPSINKVQGSTGTVSVSVDGPTVTIGTPNYGAIFTTNVTSVGKFSAVSVNYSSGKVTASVNGQYASFQVNYTFGAIPVVSGNIPGIENATISSDGKTTFTWNFNVGNDSVTLTLNMALYGTSLWGPAGGPQGPVTAVTIAGILGVMGAGFLYFWRGSGNFGWAP